MPGTLGNDNPTKGREWREALRRAMAHKSDGNYRHTLLKIAAGVVDRALEGDREAWREIADREDGKPAQAVEVANREGETFATSVEVKFVGDRPT